MIIIELRNRELRGIVTSGRKDIEITNVKKVDLPRNAIPKLIEGELDVLQDKIKELAQQLSLGYENQLFSVVINLEETLAQVLEVPKVKTKEIPFVINSALVQAQTVVTAQDLLAYALKKPEKGDKSESHQVLTNVLDKNVPDNLMKAFSELGLRLKTIDISPNTIIKAFYASNLAERSNKLDLIVDLSKQSVSYYQFHNKQFTFKYLEKANFDNIENYERNFESNVYQLLDEYGEYYLDDMNVILIGEEDIINHLSNKFEGKVNITKLSSELDAFINHSSENLGSYINSMGAAIRYDGLLSSHSKYDINLADSKKTKVHRNNVNYLLYFAIGCTVVIVGAFGFMGILKVQTIQLNNENEAISKAINEPSVILQREYYDELTKKNTSAEYLLNTVNNAESYLLSTQKEFTSAIYKTIHKNITVNSYISSISVTDGVIAIEYHSENEAAFANYTARLKATKEFESVTYNAYTVSAVESTHEYNGTVTVKLKNNPISNNQEGNKDDK